ncbi:hypothetical protein CCR75_003293 [Bremia lactucae]|uniref:Uncharacterized protein n=1 Tax=Bremia lactucae TaxID=4779 RepID=A0A976NXS3_BRELC|nr:hypothetical protein CCR75_003293 [Bremia lactucae]
MPSKVICSLHECESDKLQRDTKVKFKEALEKRQAEAKRTKSELELRKLQQDVFAVHQDASAYSKELQCQFE